MATKAEQSRTESERANSARRREHEAVPVGRSFWLKAATEKSPKGRALHGRTQRQADAKACKPMPTEAERRWELGPNGGEMQTVNGVEGAGRGADGPVDPRKVSRKSTRGGVAGGEKPSNLTRAVQRRLTSPQGRGRRGR